MSTTVAKKTTQEDIGLKAMVHEVHVPRSNWFVTSGKYKWQHVGLARVIVTLVEP